MAENTQEEDLGMLGRMKRTIRMITMPFTGDNPKTVQEPPPPDRELNLPPCAARGDAACDALLLMMKEKVLACGQKARFQFYHHAGELAQWSLSCAEKHLRSGVFSAKQLPELSFLRSIADFLETLEKCARIAGTISEQEKSIEQFAGLVSINKLRMIEDTVSDFEVALLHNTVSLLDQLEVPMRRARDARRRTLSRSGRERYSKAYDEFYKYFSSGIAIPEKKQQ